MPRVKGPYYPGGGIPYIRGALSTSCPKCDAGRGAPCRKYKIEDGQQAYDAGPRKNPHPERVSAAIARRTK